MCKCQLYFFLSNYSPFFQTNHSYHPQHGTNHVTRVQWLTDNLPTVTKREFLLYFSFIVIRLAVIPFYLCIFALQPQGRTETLKHWKRRKGNEEMSRRGVQGVEEESIKLIDQLTGFVDAKLAWGIKGDGRWGGRWWAKGSHKQTINTVSLKGETGKWGCDKSSNTSQAITIARSTIYIHTVHVHTCIGISTDSHHTGAWALSDMQDYSDLQPSVKFKQVFVIV